MSNKIYNNITNSTAVPPETARRQYLSAVVFIDGSNWYYRLKELLNDSLIKEEQTIKPPTHFDLISFCKNLVTPNKFIQATYYIGAIKQIEGNEHNQKLYSSQQKLFRFLQNQNIGLQRGQVIMHPDGSFHEKGVDLRLALDMYKDAVANTYDIAFLISSDNDLHPVVKECRAVGKEVVYVGSSLKPSFGLQKVCNRSILLQQKDILPFMPEPPPKNQQSLLSST